MKVALRGISLHVPQADWYLPPTAHDVHELVLIRRGSQYLRCRGLEYEARTGDALLFGKGVPHEEWGRAHAVFESAFLQFECGMIDEQQRMSQEQYGRNADLIVFTEHAVTGGSGPTRNSNVNAAHSPKASRASTRTV